MKKKSRSLRVIHLLILSFANLLISGSVFSQAPAALYTTANAAYKAGKFEEAAAGYEKVLKDGYQTAEVYYNLGNCYYKLEKISGSILNYERALNMAPDDEDIQHNLKLANLKAVDRILPVPQMGLVKSWNAFVASNTAKGWGVFSVVFIWMAFVAFAVYLFIGMRKVFFPVGFILLFMAIATGLLSFKQHNHEQDHNTAILTVENAFAKSAPDENGNNLFMIHEGIKFQVLDEVNTWEKIRLADGKVGWIEKGTFEKI